MRRTFVTLLAVGGLLTLGAWTTPGQSTESGQASPAEPAQTTEQRASDVCASVQAGQARDVGVRRTHTRPRARSARPPVDSGCSPALTMVRRDAHRAHRNAAIDRNLRGD